MQSDGNSLWEDVFLDSFNMTYTDEDSILDQKHVNKIFGIIIRKILNFEIY